ncbi:hypothetical protein E2C01_078087 [Portunus trituberculatus]|uniref:Uncharacterized protein n=1 Tax=Portunus trituberculatus TaxID=210409 RepID=A0A5B7IRT6_PORTR|nr:hypothetical protein [Portunus trituberculatus]
MRGTRTRGGLRRESRGDNKRGRPGSSHLLDAQALPPLFNFKLISFYDSTGFGVVILLRYSRVKRPVGLMVWRRVRHIENISC